MHRFSIRCLRTYTNILKQKSRSITQIRHYNVLPQFIVLHLKNFNNSILPCAAYSYYNAGVRFSSTNKTTDPSLNKFLQTDNKVIPDDDEETKKQKEKEKEASWRTMKLTLIFFGVSFTCIGTYLIFTLGAPEKDPNGNIVEDDLSDLPVWKQYLFRTFRELDNYRRLIKEPSREKLLPDPLKYPYFQPKYTLVLELTDVLVHPDWTYKTGWRFKKRPALDYFLDSLHGNYEIVIYTAEQGMTVFPLIEALDPKNIIAYKLVRDATHFTNGHHVKSLDKLNRDLSKVIVIDWNEHNVQFHPDNLFKVKRWSGTDDDLTLVDLSLFLKTIVENDIEDVREVLRYYSKYDDPVEAFKEKQKQLMEMLEAEGAAKKEHDTKPKAWMPSLFKKHPF